MSQSSRRPHPHGLVILTPPQSSRALGSYGALTLVVVEEAVVLQIVVGEIVVQQTIVSLGYPALVTLSGSQFWVPFRGPYLDQNPNLASRIDISGHHFSAPLFIGPCSCRAVMTFSGSQFGIRTKSVFRIKPEPPGSFVRYAVTHDA